MSYKKTLIINGETYDIAVNINGAGAPTEATEAEPGMSYLDTDSKKTYTCIGVSEGKYIWQENPDMAAVRALSVRIDKLEGSIPVEYDGSVSVS